MTKRWPKKILLAKIEGTYATDPTPTGADNAILAVDVSLSPMQGMDVERNLETPYLGNSGTLVAELHRVLSFKVELVPSGTAGTAPGWGALLRGCAVAETVVVDTSVTYNPVSDSHEALTFYLYIDGTLFKLTGARGNAKFAVSASGIPYIEFTFTGLYSAAAEATVPTATLTAFQAPKVASRANTPTFTIDGDSFVLRSFELDLGNQVETRFLIGEEEIVIPDRSEAMTATVKATALTTFDPFATAAAEGTAEVEIVHGTAAGKIATINVPKAQLMRPESLEQQQNIVEWPLRFNPLPTVGNDQWTLTLT